MRAYPILPLLPTVDAPATPRHDSVAIQPTLSESETERKRVREVAERDRQARERGVRVRRRMAQRDSLSPRFVKLDRLLKRRTPQAVSELRGDVQNLLPDRAVVFDPFEKAISFDSVVHQVESLECIAVERVLNDLGEDTSMVTETLDDRDVADVGEDAGGSEDNSASAPAKRRFRRSRLIAMPNWESLDSLLERWDSWNQMLNQSGLDSDETQNLLDKVGIRSWEPRDRVSGLSGIYEQLGSSMRDDDRVQLEAELWFRRNETERRKAYELLEKTVREADGKVVDRTTLERIGRDIVLLEIPFRVLVEANDVRGTTLSRCDSIRYLRPQQLLDFDSIGDSIEPSELGAWAAAPHDSDHVERTDSNSPTAWGFALRDGIGYPNPTSSPAPRTNALTALKALALVSKHWELSDREVAGLIGFEPAQWRHLLRASTSSTHRRNSTYLAFVPSVWPPWSQGLVTRSRQWLSAIAGKLNGKHREAPPDGITLSKDQLTRIATIFYVFTLLRQLYDRDTADGWVRQKNASPVFSGRSPIDVMVEGGLKMIRKTRDHLEAEAAR